MAVSYNTETFHDIRKDLHALGSQPTVEGVNKVIQSYDVDPEEYKEEWQTYTKAKEQGFDPSEYHRILGAPGRLVGRAIGEAGEGLIQVGEAILPEEVSSGIETVADNVSEYIPDIIKKAFAASVDPYHGEGIAAGTEEVIGNIGSYFIAGGPITKLMGKGLQATLGAEKAASRLANMTKYAIGGAAGATLVEDPSEENFVNMLRDLPKGTITGLPVGIGSFSEKVTEMFPDLEENFNALAIDPTDSRGKQYLDAFINNLALEGLFGAAFGVAFKPKVDDVAQAIHRQANTREGVKQTPLKELSSAKDPKWWSKNFSSRMGTDDTMLEMVILRENAGKAAITRADGLNSELKKILKQEGLHNDEYLEGVVNEALKGDPTAFNKLRQDSLEASNLVRDMRNSIDDLSMHVRDNFVKKSKKETSLYASMTKGKGTYINRAYRLFDDPSYKASKIPDDVRLEAEDYLINDVGLSPEVVPQYLKNLTSRDRKEAINTLAEARSGSSKPVRSRADIPEPIRKLWGEIHDPFSNFSRTFEKLSSYKAEIDFLEGAKRHLIANDLAAKGIKGVPKEYAKPRSEFADKTLGSAGEKRISELIGGSKANEFKNPLEGLYANKDYQDFIRDGTEVDGFFGNAYKTNPIISTFLKAKSATQVSKTVLAPHTHGRNTMGNVIIMAANGMFPGGKGMGLAFKTIGNKFKNMNNRDLAYGSYAGIRSNR
jgi:hypothetical protein